MTVGVFDSGVGGLTVLRAVHRRLPGVSTVYLGDTARVPYGTRSADTVERYAVKAAKFLTEREELSLFVVACNTASAVAVDALREALDVPVIGVVEPSAERAAQRSKTGRIGVIGTAGTVGSGAYQAALRRIRPEVEVVATACPLFVPLAEEGWCDEDDGVALSVAERYLSPLKAERIDTLVLGCTHYPMLRGVIGQIMGEAVELIDAAEAVAEIVASERPAESAAVSRRFYVTDLPKGFQTVAERFLDASIDDLHAVDLG